MSERICVFESTYAELESLRGADETFDDVVSPLLDGRHRRVHTGAGYWRDSDASECARQTRVELKRDVGLERCCRD
ncbi:antitoxin VapB family protein [Natronococcus sp. A-GB1]|uniref:antitoxin VapB family protein n=1 Tax=Natronococcus sp. A-GB1 TaxID=3037648 RepID=UPI00241BEF46|nr:antitoxin VapB family protein [Natronococcus sp. A-GB1]MDG5758379.1 antitoxin VapB family protein [Natronococcus sp. A-GB1]